MTRPVLEVETFLKNYLEEPAYPKWTIRESKLGGRGLFATQPIRRGALIFSNKPLVVSARADSAGVTYCSVCFNNTKTSRTCNKCYLMVCSDQCEASKEHKAECNFVSTNWIPRSNNGSYSEMLAHVHIYLRFLLLTNDQKALLPIFQNSGVDLHIEELNSLCSQYIVPEDQLEFMKNMYSTMKVNSFRIPKNSQENKVELRGLYPLSAFLNHSCIPNTGNLFRKDYTMAIYASRDISVGEEILTCYTGILWCTPARRCHLYKTKRFWCKCERCQDNTEFGTNLSALKCLNKECIGVLLPISPLSPGKEWFCDNCECRVPFSKISLIQSVLGSLVGSLQLDHEFHLDAAVLGRLAELVPNSSHIFVDLRLRLSLRLGYTGLKMNELSETRLGLKESLCRGTLRSLEVLGVGDAHLRGLLLYHLHAALAERARRSPDLYEDLKAEIESTIEQAYIILQGDISAPPDLELRRRYLGPGCDKPHQERFFILDA